MPEQRKPAPKRLTKTSAKAGGDGKRPAGDRRRRQSSGGGVAGTLIPPQRATVDGVSKTTAPQTIERAELTAHERRLLSDLFAIIEEHADHAAVEVNRRRVEEAFVYACLHHADQRRKSGEDFITHPVGVAKICAGMRLDTETLCAALLHDTVEDTSASLEEVGEAFGDEISSLVDGVTKLTGLTFQSRDGAQAETSGKMTL